MAVIQMPDATGRNGKAVLKKWLKKTGDWVNVGDELFTFEAENGTFTVKSQKAGRLVAIFVPEGEISSCPTDVGMLSPATPESVLNPGTTPYTAAEEERKAEEAAQEEVEEEPAEESTEEPTAEEPAIEEEPEEAVEEDIPEDMDIAEETRIETEETAEECEEELSEDEPTEEETPTEPASEEEDFVEDMGDEEENAEPDIEVELFSEQEKAMPCPANLGAQVNGDELYKVQKRTGISLGAMVAFAAKHTCAKEYMEDCPDTLKELNEAELPNVCDLSDSHIVNANVTCDGKLTFVVPNFEQTPMLKDGKVEISRVLNLSLCFDRNEISLETAFDILEETAKNLENFMKLLVMGSL